MIGDTVLLARIAQVLNLASAQQPDLDGMLRLGEAVFETRRGAYLLSTAAATETAKVWRSLLPMPKGATVTVRHGDGRPIDPDLEAEHPWHVLAIRMVVEAMNFGPSPALYGYIQVADSSDALGDLVASQLALHWEWKCRAREVAR